MPSKRFDEVRDYAFADQALTLRKRTGLTQIELADQLGVTNQSVYTWEAGLSYPGSERLKQVISFYLERGVLDAGREGEHAEELWETVRRRATRRLEPFDPAWFAAQRGATLSPSPTDRPPTNLPPARTSFVGRSGDIAHLRMALGQTPGPGTRLITLTGVAGCGKTRLALAAAEAVIAGYPDGVWFVELAPLSASPTADPTDIAAAVLAAFSFRDESDQAPLETLINRLGSRHLLLVLDNCEHVVAACATLATRLLAACPRLQILATSQHPLGIDDETIWHVDTLTVPPALEGELTPEVLATVRQSEAVQLFVDRAQAARPDFVPSMETAAPIVAICRELDGLPLAIELAAARLNVLSPEELLGRLASRFSVLRRGGRTLVDRHQTLQATMDWSYYLLAPEDQAVLRRLAVFAGGWDLSAAEAVCTDDLVEVGSVLESLDELEARSLIFIGTVSSVPRYGMLETVRHYGLQQLHRTGELAPTRDRQLAWCISLAERAATALQGAEQGSWLARLHRELDNLRAALQWALDRGLGTQGLHVASDLLKFWVRGGLAREGRQWMAALLAMPATEDDAAALAVRAAAAEAAAWLVQDRHDFEGASALFAESGALRRRLGQEERPATLLMNAALEARARGDYESATSLLEEYFAQQHRLGYRGSAAPHEEERLLRDAGRFTLLALVVREQGAYERARALCEQALARSRERGDVEGCAMALLSMADLARDLGDAAQVCAYGEESLALYRELRQPRAIGFALNNLALAAFMEGDLAAAASHAAESETIFRELQAEPSLAEVLITLGRIRRAQGQPDMAKGMLAEALDLAGNEGPRIVMVAAMEALAVVAIDQGQIQHGVQALSAMLELRRAMGTPVRPSDQAELKHALDEARRRLSPDAFAEAWRAGRALSAEQVVDRLRHTSRAVVPRHPPVPQF